MDYSHLVGKRLRKVRIQNNFSLKDVEKLTKKNVKASILGAYERGERVISIPRLYELGQFYNVPVDYLISGINDTETKPKKTVKNAKAAVIGGIKINLATLNKLSDKDVNLLKNYIGGIRKQREDYNVEVITIRQDDLRMLAALYQTNTNAINSKLKKFDLITNSN